MSATHEALLEAALKAAFAAGQAILEVYAKGASASVKADGSPVTEADQRAEAVIAGILTAASPDAPIVAEEAVAQGRIPERSGFRFWLVDPLDGTREFLARNGEFCVAIGLIENGRPIVGVLHGPALGLTYAGIVGTGAWQVDADATRRPIAARPAPGDGLTVLVSRSHRDQARVASFLGSTPVAGQRPMGSALKLGLIAAGEADLYPRLGPTFEWDTAAGEAILVAAGGSLAALDGRPLVYGKPGFLNPEFVARGRA